MQWTLVQLIPEKYVVWIIFAQPQILVLTKQSTLIQYPMSMKIYKTVENAKIFSTSLKSDNLVSHRLNSPEGVRLAIPSFGEDRPY